MSNISARRWCFTIFENEFELFNRAIGSKPDGIRYCVWQLECSPTTKRDHYQGYCELTRPFKMAGVKKLLSCKSIHLERANGSREACRDYCRKEESRKEGPFEYGEWESGGQGKRNDLAPAISLICEDPKGGYKRVATEYPAILVKHHKGLQALQEAQKNPYLGKSTIICYYGVAGIGKTRRAWHECPDSYNFVAKPGQEWWDGYAGESTVIVDDYSGQLPYRYFLQLCDPYSKLVRLPVKGGFVTREFSKLVFTSNEHPRFWYTGSDVGFDVEQVLRRFTVIEEIVTEFNPDK